MRPRVTGGWRGTVQDLRAACRLTTVLALTMLALVRCDQSTPAEPERRLTPDFILVDLSGQEFQLSKEAGKVVILNFFLTTCSTCQSEIPGLIAAHNEYKDKGLVVVGIALDPSKLAAFGEEFGIPYRLLSDNGVVSVAYGVINSVPVTVTIDRDGWIVGEYERYISDEELISIIDGLL